MNANWNSDELNLNRNHPGNANANSRLRSSRSTLVDRRSPDTVSGLRDYSLSLSHAFLLPRANHVSYLHDGGHLTCVPSFRDEPSLHRDAQLELEVVECHAHLDEVIRSSAGIRQRPKRGEEACVAIVEEVSPEQVLIEFRKVADETVTIVPEDSKLTYEWDGIHS